MRKKHERTKEEYENAIKNAKSIAEALRNLGLIDRGGNYKIIKLAAKKYDIDMSHFDGQGWNKGLKFVPRQPKKLEEIMVENSSYSTYHLKERILKEGVKEYKCEKCGAVEWLGNPIPLELHHINGDNTDNRLENIQILCPNCHALTDNYRGKNKSAH